MTFEELAKQILALPEEQRKCDATVSCDLAEEALPVTGLHIVRDGDFLEGVLDNNHPVITIDF